MEEMKKEINMNEEAKTEGCTEVKESMFKKVSNKVAEGAKKYGPTAKKVVKGAVGVGMVLGAFALGKNLSSKNSNSTSDYEVGESNDDYTTFVEANEEE